MKSKRLSTTCSLTSAVTLLSTVGVADNVVKKLMDVSSGEQSWGTDTYLLCPVDKDTSMIIVVFDSLRADLCLQLILKSL